MFKFRFAQGRPQVAASAPLPLAGGCLWGNPVFDAVPVASGAQGLGLGFRRVSPSSSIW